MIRIPLKLIKGGKEGDLLTQGWIKQTTIGEPRLSEIAETYRQLGYETHIVPHPADDPGAGCNACFSADADHGQMTGDLFIRKDANARPVLDDELF